MSNKILHNLHLFIKDNKNPEDILNHIHELVMSGDPKPRTITNRYSKIKRFLRDEFDIFTEEFLRKIKPDDSITQSVIDMDKETRQNKSTIKFSQQDIDKTLGLKDNKRITDKLIYLQLVSGRRINELIDPEMKITLPRKKGHVVFSHLSKQRDNKEKSVVKLMDEIKPKEFKELLEDVRNKIQELGLTIRETTNKVNMRMKKLFPKRDIKSSHNLRGMYAVVMWYRSGRTQNINGYISDVLNHTTPDASLNYSNYVFEE
jgi:hypothetical protein